MRKTAPVRRVDTSFGLGRSSAVGDALRVLEQVDSDLHLARLADASRQLKEELARKGLTEPARIADRIVDLASTAIRARSALAPRDLRTLHHEYFKLARSLEPPEQTGPSAEHRWSRWATRRREQA